MANKGTDSGGLLLAVVLTAEMGGRLGEDLCGCSVVVAACCVVVRIAVIRQHSVFLFVNHLTL